LKNRRQHKILEIIKNEIIATQKDLAEALRKNGFTVTQATVSRDIKELGLTKMSLDGNPARYTLAGEKRTYRSEEHLKRLFRDSVVGLDFSENLIVIKTHPGEAQAVALAIDQVGWKEIIGTVGGDDTVLVIVKPKRETGAVLKRFEDLSLNRG